MQSLTTAKRMENVDEIMVGDYMPLICLLSFRSSSEESRLQHHAGESAYLQRLARLIYRAAFPSCFVAEYGFIAAIAPWLLKMEVFAVADICSVNF